MGPVKIRKSPEFQLPGRLPRPVDPPAAAPIDQRKSDPWTVHLAEAADAVYADLQWAKVWLEAQGFSQVTAFEHGFTQAIGYVKDGRRCVVFRGTQEKLDWVMDLLCIYWGSPPRHLGFQVGWAIVRAEVLQWLNLVAPAASDGVVLAGHSLGGAIAIVAAMDLKRENFAVERVVTFGCPRVGSAEFAWRYARSGLKAKTHQFKHAQDGICVIPPVIAYVHVTEAQPLGGSPVLAKSRAYSFEEPPVPNQRPGIFLLLASLVPWFGNTASFLGYMHVQNLNSRWVDPEQSTLGKQHRVWGYALFVLVLLATRVLLARSELSQLLVAEIPKNRLLFGVTTLAEAFVLQQACYGVAIGLPAAARLLLSLGATLALFWFFPVRQIEALVVPALVVLLAILLLIGYRAGGGAPDHFMAHYLTALSARTARVPSEEFLREQKARDVWERIRRGALLRKGPL